MNMVYIGVDKSDEEDFNRELRALQADLATIVDNSDLAEFEPRQEWFAHRCPLHGIDHLTRDLIYAELLMKPYQDSNNGVNENPNVEMVRWAAVTHDVRRTGKRGDHEHGKRAANWFGENFAYLDSCIVEGVMYLNKWHTPADRRAPEMTDELKVFKDADSLDRVRIGDLNLRFLRTPRAGEMAVFAKYLFRTSRRIIEGNGAYAQRPYQAVMHAARLLVDYKVKR